MGRTFNRNEHAKYNVGEHVLQGVAATRLTVFPVLWFVHTERPQTFLYFRNSSTTTVLREFLFDSLLSAGFHPSSFKQK